MDGSEVATLIVLIRECFPAITAAQVALATIELTKLNSSVAKAAVELFVRTESDFTVARLLMHIREQSLRARPASPNFIAETKRLELQIRRARELMARMDPDELEKLQQESLDSIGPPLRERLIRVPPLECRRLAMLVVERYVVSDQSVASCEAVCVRDK